ncbi:hypothetical protein [Aequorivita echinoideorum]|uniref:Cystatin domain-containing protein n=1 Tax=Aequorivita echinoideorum TaxID=1549647 RepID=A0ABS5S4S8_9FLAO|nr:hypothetical protein [Aequorivita echinoideorum]MBT0608203.1 hypothetical protein [Aequorivita echinoideorum]
MKKLLVILSAFLVLSCADNKANDQDEVREVAKRDIIEKLDLPEGTKFNDENIEVTETEMEDGSLGYNYLVKITVKSQDRAGNEIVKTHTMQYKKLEDAKDYELTAFE